MNRLLIIDDEVELGRPIGLIGESVGFEAKVTARIAEFKESLATFAPGEIMSIGHD